MKKEGNKVWKYSGKGRLLGARNNPKRASFGRAEYSQEGIFFGRATTTKHSNTENGTCQPPGAIGFVFGQHEVVFGRHEVVFGWSEVVFG